jgi:phosphoenolpyruvate synthase/pyruvate phosphate dikinase
VKGIGLARMEFIINNIIQIHPRALVEFEDLEDLDLKARDREASPAAMRTRRSTSWSTSPAASR